MKHLIKLRTILSLAFVFALASTTAHAQNSFSFDENGNGFFNGAAFPGGLMPFDPSGGVVGAVLVYNVPAAAGVLTMGDVLLAESIAPGITNVSDIVRFWTNNLVIFYSERETTGAG